MQRRKFIKGAGLVSGILGGVFAGKTIVEKHYIQTKEVAPIKEDIVHLAPDVKGMSYLSLHANYSPEKQSSPSFSPALGEYSFTMTNPTPTHKVDLAVGKDNRLWIRYEGNEWKRLAIDS